MPGRFISLIFLILGILIVSVILGFYHTSSWYLEVGQLIILSITLAIIIYYAWQTHRIANATEMQWEEEMKPKLMYEIAVDQSKKQSDIVKFSLINPTDYIIETNVNCNFKIYGEAVQYDGAYDGTKAWVVFPHQGNVGWFSIDLLLSKKGKNRGDMIKERNESNQNEQLTMDLEIRFTSETGRSREYPPRRHYFAFDKWIWVPVITK
jgi:hypothetical protein